MQTGKTALYLLAWLIIDIALAFGFYLLCTNKLWTALHYVLGLL